MKLSHSLQKLIGASLLAVAFASNFPALAAPSTAGWGTVQKLVANFQTKGPNDKSALSASTVAQTNALIDYRMIAARSMGKADWNALSQSQKNDLVATLQNLVESRYYPRWKKIFGKGQVSYLNQNHNDGDLFVATSLHLGSKDQALTWQLSDGAQPKVISLAVGKNDLLTRLTQRIRAHQAKGGYTAMIAWLKGKGKVDIADGDTPDADPSAKKPLKTSSRAVELID